MKLLSITCPHCGAKLQTTQNAKMLTCDYCNCDFMVDDEVKRMRLVNAEQAGYEFEMGRQRALEEKKQAGIKSRSLKLAKHVDPVYIWVVCPYCGKENTVRIENESVLCEHCGWNFNVKVGEHIRWAINHEEFGHNIEAIGSFYKAYELDNSSTIARQGIQRLKEKLKFYAFIKVNVPHVFSKDDTLAFRIGVMAYIKNTGKEEYYYYRDMTNIDCDDKFFWFDYPGKGCLKFSTDAPKYIVKFLLNAKKGIYPSFKEIL